MPSRFIASALLFCGLILTTCSTLRAAESPKLDLLYLLASPHARLYVEVDAVEGSEPKDTALQQLRNFLAAHCDKRDAIEVTRSDVIPANKARGISPRALARRYINGPDKGGATPPAFMYVLYYNYPLTRRSADETILHRGARTLPAQRSDTAKPFAETYPYPAIYFNAHFSLGLAMNEILLHEAGHLLGLVDRGPNARSHHCLNRGCQMNKHSDYLRQFRWLPGRKQSPLCADCVAELAQRRTQVPPQKLRYVGPVLVRSEADYHVLLLPERAGVVVGNLTDRDCEQFVRSMRGSGDDDGWRLHCMVKDDIANESARLARVITGFKDDPFSLVRRGGPQVLIRACVSQHQSHGLYSNAVETLQQGIALDPKDAWNHNQLAWIKATCPDPSIRHGNEAVTAATRACEFTSWKNPRYLDTLAAACAEAGDFKRAIQFQQRALRTATNSDHQAMRARLALYQQSKPYRANRTEPQ